MCPKPLSSAKLEFIYFVVAQALLISGYVWLLHVIINLSHEDSIMVNNDKDNCNCEVSPSQTLKLHAISAPHNHVHFVIKQNP
jgi:hypothetical protein